MDKNEFQKLLDIYYNLRGWDNKGIPTFETLKKFGLEDIAKDLYAKELK
ncbi:MAG: aldehyde ferredoxin oxidoreductase C-terminal domain-containing protein [Promethearchaeota archaeon]